MSGPERLPKTVHVLFGCMSAAVRFKRSDRLPCRARGSATLAAWAKPPGLS